MDQSCGPASSDRSIVGNHGVSFQFCFSGADLPSPVRYRAVQWREVDTEKVSHSKVSDLVA